MKKTKLLKIAELGKPIKDVVIGTEGGEQEKAEKRRMRIAFSCLMCYVLNVAFTRSYETNQEM